MRDVRIDILRFIGLAMIILAHVDPPGLIFQLRNFDVPLMVLVSGMSFSLAYKSHDGFFCYVWKRFKRLVLPVWIFLSIFFLIHFLLIPGYQNIDRSTMLSSYLLINGIGYVWVIRVFLMVSFVAPFLFLIASKIVSHNIFLVFLAVMLSISELVRYIFIPYVDYGVGKLLSLFGLYIIPYSLVFLIGLRLVQMNRIQIRMIFIFCGVMFFLLLAFFYGLNSTFVSTQEFKYPPGVYYLSYALFVSTFLWLNSERLLSIVESLRLKKIVCFIANNSIWIYLWHIPLIQSIHMHYISKYFSVFLIAVVIVYVQVSILNKIILPRIKNNLVVMNVKSILMG